jgi:hypothetical protein
LLTMLILPVLAFSSPIKAESLKSYFSRAKLEASGVKFQQADLDLIGGGDYGSPHFKNLMADLLGTPSYFRIQKNRLYEKQNEIDHLLLQTLSHQGLGYRRNLVGDPNAQLSKLSEKPESLVKAIAKVYSLKGMALSTSAKKQIQQFQKQASKELSKNLAYLIYVLHSAELNRARAFQRVSKSLIKRTKKDLLREQRYSADIFQSLSDNILETAKNTDLKSLSVGAIDIAIALNTVKKSLVSFAAEKPLLLSLQTPLGKLVVDSRKRDSTHAGPFFFVLDTSGNDTYIAKKKVEGAPELLIDVQGDDHYLYHNDLKATAIKDSSSRSNQSLKSFASGFFSYSFLVDFSGNDTYRSASLSQGAGMFGVGVLWDVLGNDTYDCYNFCQAAAKFGAGLLVDNEGEDKYFTFSEGQAFASTKGSSALLDFGNDSDQYIAHNAPTDYPAYYDKSINSSFAQGAALGYRPRLYRW